MFMRRMLPTSEVEGKVSGCPTIRSRCYRMPMASLLALGCLYTIARAISGTCFERTGCRLNICSRSLESSHCGRKAGSVIVTPGGTRVEHHGRISDDVARFVGGQNCTLEAVLRPHHRDVRPNARQAAGFSRPRADPRRFRRPHRFKVDSLASHDAARPQAAGESRERCQGFGTLPHDVDVVCEKTA
jgi:hypothetical protein